MKLITKITVQPGDVPWLETIISWEGVSDTWFLVDMTTEEIIYYGKEKTVTVKTLPGDTLKLRLSSPTTYEEISYIVPLLPAPTGFSQTSSTSDSVALYFQEVLGATEYEIANAAKNYEVIMSVPSGNQNEIVTITKLQPNSSYSLTIRSLIKSDDRQIKSRWSPAILVKTDRAGNVLAMDYEFVPNSMFVWNSERGWISHDSPAIHGSTTENDIYTTVFFFSPEQLQAMRELQGARISSLKIFIKRYSDSGDPKATLSHWLAHKNKTKPEGQITSLSDGVDAGIVSRGESEWVDLPVGWAYGLTTGLVGGLAWGNVAGRYQTAANIFNSLPDQVTGTIRITVI